jgi:hypothetical protein
LTTSQHATPCDARRLGLELPLDRRAGFARSSANTTFGYGVTTIHRRADDDRRGLVAAQHAGRERERGASDATLSRVMSPRSA